MKELFNRKGTDGAATNPNLSEPTRMDVQIVEKPDGSTYANIFFVERLGKVKFYNGATNTVTEMGSISTLGRRDNGLMGLALHPDFAKNRWVYFWYSPNELVGLNRKLRLTRITVTPDHKLDMNSEKILIEILGSKVDTWHSGGPMTFDKHGDLWVTVGNNSLDLNPTTLNVLSHTDSSASSEWGSSNTASLRGGIFRIHPDSSEKGYRIPAGNFGEYWAKEFDKQGKSALAAEYRDPKKVLPEVYVKGTRSNFSIAVHPTKQWVAWGDVNYSNNNDEFNITTHPIFAGYPYYHADNKKTGAHEIDAKAPRNTSPLNSGVIDLPPAVPATLSNVVNISMGGPIYLYDRNLKSKVKFPPHFHYSWIGFGWGQSQMHLMTLDSNSAAVKGTQRLDNALFNDFPLRNPVQGIYGADGALYILNYDGNYDTAINPGVMRFTYTGQCRLEPVSIASKAPLTSNPRVDFTGNRLRIGETGKHVISLFDMAGKQIFQIQGQGAADYSLSNLAHRSLPHAGLHILRVETTSGVIQRIVSGISGEGASQIRNQGKDAP